MKYIKMQKNEIKVTAAALLIMAIIYYTAEPKEILALLVPAAVHELGHLTALKILGLRIREFRLDAKGLCINYCGHTGELGHILCAAAGPAAGFIYAYFASKYGTGTDSSFLCLSAGVSFILSVFNLLPAVPLDGGRIAARISVLLFGEKTGAVLAAGISFAVAIAVLAAGLWLMFGNRGTALLIFAIWLLFYQESPKGIVKRREIL